jgi:hypothetical protein
MINNSDLIPFISESNLIEGIYRAPIDKEIFAHHRLLSLKTLAIEDVELFVKAVAEAPPRFETGLNVYVGSHRPPPGGPQVRRDLNEILTRANLGTQPFEVHQQYETLHPFLDGNGRSGRAIWLWQMINQVRDPYVLTRKFLHTWYYQSLSVSR